MKYVLLMLLCLVGSSKVVAGESAPPNEVLTVASVDVWVVDSYMGNGRYKIKLKDGSDFFYVPSKVPLVLGSVYQPV